MDDILCIILVAPVVSVAEPPLLLVLMLVPEIPFRRSDNFAARSPMRSPPVAPLVCSCSFFLRSCLRLLTLLSFAFPTPPALRMDSSKPALPLSTGGRGLLGAGVAVGGGWVVAGGGWVAAGGGGGEMSAGGGGGGGGGGAAEGGGGGGGGPGGGGAGTLAPVWAGPAGITSDSGTTDGKSGTTAGRSGMLLPGTDGAIDGPSSALYDRSSATPVNGTKQMH